MSFETTILRVILALVPAGMPAFGQGISLSLLSASATLNSTVTLPLNVASTSGSEPAGLQWTILYSTTDFSSITAAAGAAASAAGKGIDCASIGPGQYTCVLAGINQNTISNGTAATVTLRVSGTTTHTSSTVQVSSPVAA